MSARGWRFRFGLGLLFVLLTATTIACAYWFRAGTHVTKIILRVKTPRSVLTEPTDRVLTSDRLGEISLMTSLVKDLVTSDFILHDVLRSPAIANLPLLASVDEPVEWLADHVKARSVPDSELVTIYMYSTASTSSQVQTILDQVAQSCQDEMNASAIRENANICEILEKETRRIGKQIDEFEARLENRPFNSFVARELEALKQTYISARRRRHELQIERTAINPLMILERATTEIRKPFWK